MGPYLLRKRDAMGLGRLMVRSAIGGFFIGHGTQKYGVDRLA